MSPLAIIEFLAPATLERTKSKMMSLRKYAFCFKADFVMTSLLLAPVVLQHRNGLTIPLRSPPMMTKNLFFVVFTLKYN